MSGRRLLTPVAGAAAAIAAITLLARVVGFGRWFVFSGTVGSSCVGTAYSSANLLPNVLYEVVAGGALAACVVPVISARLVHADLGAANRAAAAMLGWTLLLLTPLAVLVSVLAEPLARLLVDGSTCPGVVEAAARMLVVFAPQVVLYGVGLVLVGVLQAHRRFVGPAVAPLASSLVVIVTYLVFARVSGRPTGPAASSWLPERGAEALLAWGTTVGVLMLSLPLLVPAWRAGVRLRPTLRFEPGVARQVRSLATAGLAGLLAQQVLVLSTARLANTAGLGTLNVYQYGQAVYLLPYAVLAVPVATAAYPTLARYAEQGDGGAYARTLARSTRLVLLVAVAGAAMLVAGAPAVGAAFSASDVGGGPLDALAPSLTAFAPGLVGFALIAHLGRALFVAGRARWAARATVAGWLTAAALSWVLVLADVDASPRSVLVSLGLASAVGMSVAGANLLLGASRLQVGGTVVGSELAQLWPGAVRCLVAGVVAAAAGRWVGDVVLSASGSDTDVGAGFAHAVTAGVSAVAVVAMLLAAATMTGLLTVVRQDLPYRGRGSAGA